MRQILTGSTWIVAALAAVSLSACMSPNTGPKDYVTVKYDPNDYDQSNLQRLATAQCRAKGYSAAGPSYAQPNMDAANWSYQSFGCY